MNYLEHFGLQAEPFLNVPSTKTFYKSATHGRALLRLMTLADGEACVVRLIGVPGVGKSLLLRRVLDSLSEETHRVAFVPVGGRSMDAAALATILGQQLRIAGANASLRSIDEGCAAHAEDSIRTVIFIDDADRLDAAVLESLDTLANAVVILAGAPGDWYPDGPEIALDPLNEEGTEGYLRLRLKLAGRSQDIFSAESRRKIHELTGGIPWRINAVCELALLTAMLAGRERIEPDILEGVGVLAATPPVFVAASTGSTFSASHPAAEPDGSDLDEEEEDEDDILAQLASEEAAEDEDATASGRIDDDAESDDLSFGNDDDDVKSDDDDDELDDLLGELESEHDSDVALAVALSMQPSQSGGAASRAPALDSDAADDDLGDLLDGLSEDDDAGNAAAEQSSPEESADDDLSDLLGSLDEDEPSGGKSAPKQTTAAASASDDEFGDMLDGLGESEAPQVAAAPDDDEIDDLLSDLVSGTDEDPNAGGDAGDDLDDLLSGLDDDSPKSAPSQPIASQSKDLAADFDDGLDESFDNLLNEAGDKDGGASGSGNEDLDDLLSGLGDEDEAGGDDDDLDDLLSGMVEAEPPPPPPAPTPVRAPVGAAAQVADDDLESLLDSLDEAPAAVSKDDLESELDSLLDGLDD